MRLKIYRARQIINPHKNPGAARVFAAPIVALLPPYAETDKTGFSFVLKIEASIFFCGRGFL